MVLTVAFAVFVACVAYFVISYLQYKSINDFGSSYLTSTVSSEIKVKTVDVPVDFSKLKSVNDEIYAWINIPGTNIDYPILQSKTHRSFYLDHNVEKKKSSYGAIYTQDYNTMTFEDYNTVIYGHNMKNGTMFGSLKKYRDRAFFDQNQYIYIYMPGVILKYRIFAAYTFDDRHILLSFDFSDEDDRRLYLDEIYSIRSLNSNFRDDITVGVNDKIITLSTCTSKDDERFLVQGVLVYDSRNP
ncbi:MAG: class B sortase [Acutalibacteraceae bacterium]